MKKLYIIIVFLMSGTAYSSEQLSIEELYRTDTMTNMLEEVYKNNKSKFSSITVKEARAGIEQMISEGYETVEGLKLKDYLKEIDRNKSNVEKVQEIYFYAMNKAMPSRDKMITSKEDIEASTRKARQLFKDNMGIELEEFEILLEEQEKADKNN